jgi:outer membrane protein OmpA-like peptidoglycan-associated protein
VLGLGAAAGLAQGPDGTSDARPGRCSTTPPRREVKIYLPADVLFEFDKADLRPEAAPVLERVASALRSDPTSSAAIEGSRTARATINTTQPCRSAVHSRCACGSPPMRCPAVAARGFGKTRPVALNTMPNGADNPDGRQKNRRVEITFTTAQ